MTPRRQLSILLLEASMKLIIRCCLRDPSLHSITKTRYIEIDIVFEVSRFENPLPDCLEPSEGFPFRFSWSSPGPQISYIHIGRLGQILGFGVDYRYVEVQSARRIFCYWGNFVHYWRYADYPGPLAESVRDRWPQAPLSRHRDIWGASVLDGVVLRRRHAKMTRYFTASSVSPPAFENGTTVTT